MAVQAWHHRERLLFLGGAGLLMAMCGAVATLAGVPSARGLAMAGLVLAVWEALGLALWAVRTGDGRRRQGG
ncbi:hypothetical protein G3I40_37320 [Streptomyces sp. SID14478]|nr:hypothetical protein [Streptomyces sp. SID14478]